MEDPLMAARSAVDRAVKQKRFPAISVALVHKGKTVFSYGSGVVCSPLPPSVEHKDGSTDGGAPVKPCDPNSSIFAAASISKTVVALVAAQCAERGELDLDADINDYLNMQEEKGNGKTWSPCSQVQREEAPLKVQNPHFEGVPITARHLLTHHSGLRDDESALKASKDNPWRQEGKDSTVPLAQYVSSRLIPGGEHFSPKLWYKAQPPGPRCPYHYSNAGFTLLALVIERATQVPLTKLAQQRVFTPLGMERTCFTLQEAFSMARDKPKGQVTLAVPHHGTTPIGHYGVAEWPAAGMQSTAGDLARYLAALSSKEKASTVLSQELMEELLPRSYTGGLAWWGLDSRYGREGCWTHGGFMEGVRTHVYLYKEESAGAVILTNGEGRYQDISSVLIKALSNITGTRLL